MCLAKQNLASSQIICPLIRIQAFHLDVIRWKQKVNIDSIIFLNGTLLQVFIILKSKE